MNPFRKFLIFAVTIALFGLFLRLIDYQKVPPFDVTKDEFFYPWSGMTFIKTGNPTAWSLFDSYTEAEVVYKWGTWYRIVSPWVEKPPLYAIMSGLVVIASGAADMFDVRLSVIRLLPIFLSFSTIILIGLVARKFFDDNVSYLSMIFYATVPTIVMANRLSLVENLLTPLVLLGIYIFSEDFKSKFTKNLRIYSVGIVVALCLLTKNIGIALPLVFIWILLREKNYKDFSIIFIFSTIFTLVHPLIGYIYNWELFLNVMRDYQRIHALVGPPEVVQTIFRFPIVGHQWDRLFLDGGMLAGYILLFSSPFILHKFDERKSTLLLGFPLLYLLVLSLLESGSTPYSFFGWHVYPLFPFMMILLAKAAHELINKPNLIQMLFFFLLLGFSSLRFLTILMPEITKSWQPIAFLTVSILIVGLMFRRNLDKAVIYGALTIFLIINVLVVFSLNQIYPGFAQPPN